MAVSSSSDNWYGYTDHGFDSPINNGNLITYTGSGLYTTTMGSMPNTVFNNANYFRDVVFVAGGGGGATPTPTPTPTPGATATPTPTPTATPTPQAGAYLGYNSVGSNNDGSSANDLNVFRFQAGSSFTPTQMKVYLANAVTGRMKLAIYSDSSGSPSDLLKGTNEINNPGTGWITFTLTSSQVITSGTYYWLAIWCDAAYTPKGETSGGTSRYKALTYGSWPSPIGSTTGPYTTKDSIYAQ